MRKEDAVIGARVVATVAVDGNGDTLNETGTIIWNRPFIKYDLCVEFDEDVSGHAGQHREFSGKGGHCWWGMFADFELEDVVEGVEIKLSFDELLGGS